MKESDITNNSNFKTSITPISLKGSSSEAQQTKLLASHTQGQEKVVIGAWKSRNFMVESLFKTNDVFSVL